jgi:predicted DNA-binding protein
MTITIRLPEETERKLTERAEEHGQPVEVYVVGLIENDLAPTADMPFDQLLDPVRREFERSGITDAELDDLFTAAREAVARESAG